MSTKTKAPLFAALEQALAKRKADEPIAPAFFGKDHWSLLGYIETLTVDAPHGRHGKFVAFDHERMRCDVDRHPGLRGYRIPVTPGKKYPTRLAEMIELHDHDDWDCLADLEAAGIVQTGGTGILPTVKLTELGQQVSAKLREHKGNEGNFSEFRWDPRTGSYSIKAKKS